MANYSKHEERSADVAQATRDYARWSLSDPPRYTCAVCGIEKTDGVPIWALSERRRHSLLCTDHIPKSGGRSPNRSMRHGDGRRKSYLPAR